MAYDSEQKKVIREIIKGAQRRFKGNKTLQKRARIAGFETGLVERNLHNSGPVTDGTSQGWREETASSYPGVNRRDLKGSVARFMSEIAGPLKAGQHSSEAAANVQRPAAQYRGRYKQNQGQAMDIEKFFASKYGGNKSAGPPSLSSSGKKVTAQITVPGVDNSGQRKQLLLDYLNVRDQPDSLLNLASGLKSAQDVPAQTLTKSIKIPGQKSDQGTSKSLGGDAVKKNGLGNFEGHKVAAWIVPQLQYARAHGWKGPVTSGYRSHAYNVAQGRTYHSQHEETGYGKGAVDFGGMQDAAGLANRESFFRALKGYKGRTVQRPKGFRDDGHTSGTGG